MPDQIPISELRQLQYCERIPFYHLRLGLRGVGTHRMSEGQIVEWETLQLERRRTLAWYGLNEGIRAYRVPVENAVLGLTGIIDLVIRSERGTIPIEVKAAKDTNAVAHRDQIVAYALCIEQDTKRTVPFGILVYVSARGERSQRRVDMTPARRRRAARMVQRIRDIQESEYLPDATRDRHRCRWCEFRRFCADVN